MSERRFFDSEALIDALVKSTTEIDLEFDTNLLLKKLKQNDADILNDAILQVLKESELVSDVEHHQTIPPPGQQQGFGLRLRRKIKDGHTEKVTFYRVKESLKTGYLSLVGFAAGLWMNSPSVVIPGTSLLINSWRNFISLKHPQDKFAFSAYEALLRVQIKMVEDSGVSYYYASTEEIHSETDNESMKDTIIGLTQLLDLKLVEVKKWGGLQYDNSHIKNSWYQTF